MLFNINDFDEVVYPYHSWINKKYTFEKIGYKPYKLFNEVFVRLMTKENWNKEKNGLIPIIKKVYGDKLFIIIV